MAIELLTPFTKVELEPEVKDKKRKQIGILGGNFNPVHNAHLVVADQVRQQLGLDQVLLMPEYEPPHVDKKETIDEKHRLKMLELAIEGIAGLGIETIELELIFSDLEVLDRRMAKTKKLANNDKDAKKEYALLEKLHAHLEEGKLAINFEAEEEDAAFLDSLGLLTRKPVIYACNVGEESLSDDGASNPYVQKVREYAKKNHSESFVISAQIEQEISELSDEEKGEYLESLGLSESGLDKIVRASYSLLGLMSYLTAGEKETRAWTIKKGTKAPQAAGKIHTDFERGFIKAEVVNYKDLLDNGSLSAAREKGLVRMEGKEYVMQDGDVVLFRFNV